MTPAFGCVVLTAGRRPDDLRAAVDSLLRQGDVEVDVVVVGNGCEPAGRAGRRAGSWRCGPTTASRPAATPACRTSRGELLFFLDDDAELAGAGRAAPRRARCSRPTRSWAGPAPRRAARPRRAPRSRDWVPRLRVGDPARSSEITVVWEGAVGDPPRGVRAGGRLAGASSASCTRASTSAGACMDAGWRMRYAGDVGGPPPVADRDAARVLVLFRCAQPSVARAPSPAAAAGRALRELASRCAPCPG